MPPLKTDAISYRRNSALCASTASVYLGTSTSRAPTYFGSQIRRNEGPTDMEIDSPPPAEKALSHPWRGSVSRSTFQTSKSGCDRDLSATAASHSELRLDPWRGSVSRSTLQTTKSGCDRDLPATAARHSELPTRLAGIKRRGEAVEQDQPAQLKSTFRQIEKPHTRRPSKPTATATRRRACYFTDPSSSLYPREHGEVAKPRGRAEGAPQKLAKTGSHHHYTSSTAVTEARVTASQQQPDEAMMFRDLSNKNFDFSNPVPSSSTISAIPPELGGLQSVPYGKPAVNIVARNRDLAIAVAKHCEPAIAVAKHCEPAITAVKHREPAIEKVAKEPPPVKRPVPASMAPAELARSRCQSLQSSRTADEQDSLWAEYAVEMLEHLAVLERDNRSSPSYMPKQHELNSAMRKILINWLITVAVDFGLSSETLSLTVDITDRFLSRKRVSRETFQLVGVTALFIASKVEETHACSLKELVGVCAGAYTAKQIVRMECAMARALDFRFRNATAWDFCTHYWRLLGAEPAACEFRRTGGSTAVERRSLVMADREARGLSGWIETARELSEYLVDLSQTEYAFLQYRPSEIAISAIVMALHSLYLHYRIPASMTPQFTPEYILKMSGYDVSGDPRVQGCIAALNSLREDASRSLREARAGPSDAAYDGLWTKYPGVE